MDRQKILNKYAKSEDKLLISKMFDKIDLCISRNKIENTDFLDENQLCILKKILISENVKNYLILGGIENAERNIIIFFPEKLKEIINNNINSIIPIQCIRIILPKQLHNKYSHRDYLGGIIKLGIKREKIGDILVFEDGADILILNDISKFIINNILSLTRFSKSKVETISLEDVRNKIINTKTIEVNVSSMRLDCIIAEVLNTSRKIAEEIICQKRAFINHEEIIKATKQVKEKDLLTIRGKGRFEIVSINGTTKNDRIKLTINKFI